MKRKIEEEEKSGRKQLKKVRRKERKQFQKNFFKDVAKNAESSFYLLGQDSGTTNSKLSGEPHPNYDGKDKNYLTGISNLHNTEKKLEMLSSEIIDDGIKRNIDEIINSPNHLEEINYSNNNSTNYFNKLQIAVVPLWYPGKKFSFQQFTAFKRYLMQKLDQIEPGTIISPKFNGIYCYQGVFVINCHDDMTHSWILGLLNTQNLSIGQIRHFSFNNPELFQIKKFTGNFKESHRSNDCFNSSEDQSEPKSSCVENTCLNKDNEYEQVAQICNDLKFKNWPYSKSLYFPDSVEKYERIDNANSQGTSSFPAELNFYEKPNPDYLKKFCSALFKESSTEISNASSCDEGKDTLHHEYISQLKIDETDTVLDDKFVEESSSLGNKPIPKNGCKQDIQNTGEPIFLREETVRLQTINSFEAHSENSDNLSFISADEIQSKEKPNSNSLSENNYPENRTISQFENALKSIDKENTGCIKTLQLALVPRCYPKKTFSPKQLNTLPKEILIKLNKIAIRSGISPKFDGIYCYGGVVLVNCVDNMSRSWIQDIVKKQGFSIGEILCFSFNKPKLFQNKNIPDKNLVNSYDSDDFHSAKLQNESGLFCEKSSTLEMDIDLENIKICSNTEPADCDLKFRGNNLEVDIKEVYETSNLEVDIREVNETSNLEVDIREVNETSNLEVDTREVNETSNLEVETREVNETSNLEVDTREVNETSNLEVDIKEVNETSTVLDDKSQGEDQIKHHPVDSPENLSCDISDETQCDGSKSFLEDGHEEIKSLLLSDVLMSLCLIMAIVPDRYPKSKFTLNQLNAIKKAILLKIDRINPEICGISPKFDGIYCYEGAFIVNCADNESKSWLRNNVNYLGFGGIRCFCFDRPILFQSKDVKIPIDQKYKNNNIHFGEVHSKSGSLSHDKSGLKKNNDCEHSQDTYATNPQLANSAYSEGLSDSANAVKQSETDENVNWQRISSSKCKSINFVKGSLDKNIKTSHQENLKIIHEEENSSFKDSTDNTEVVMTHNPNAAMREAPKNGPCELLSDDPALISLKNEQCTTNKKLSLENSRNHGDELVFVGEDKKHDLLSQDGFKSQSNAYQISSCVNDDSIQSKEKFEPISNWQNECLGSHPESQHREFLKSPERPLSQFLSENRCDSQEDRQRFRYDRVKRSQFTNSSSRSRQVSIRNSKGGSSFQNESHFPKGKSNTQGKYMSEYKVTAPHTQQDLYKSGFVEGRNSGVREFRFNHSTRPKHEFFAQDEDSTVSQYGSDFSKSHWRNRDRLASYFLHGRSQGQHHDNLTYSLQENRFGHSPPLELKYHGVEECVREQEVSHSRWNRRQEYSPFEERSRFSEIPEDEVYSYGQRYSRSECRPHSTYKHGTSTRNPSWVSNPDQKFYSENNPRSHYNRPASAQYDKPCSSRKKSPAYTSRLKYHSSIQGRDSFRH